MFILSKIDIIEMMYVTMFCEAMDDFGIFMCQHIRSISPITTNTLSISQVSIIKALRNITNYSPFLCRHYKDVLYQNAELIYNDKERDNITQIIKSKCG